MSESQPIAEWQTDLVVLLTSTLAEFRRDADDEMRMFSVDLHPWNGTIVVALLTQSESEASPELVDAAEMAAWRYYNFGASLASWEASAEMEGRMRRSYDAAGDDKSDVAKKFFEACALAVSSSSVRDVLATFRRSHDFGISVAHPDSGHEFYDAARANR